LLERLKNTDMTIYELPDSKIIIEPVRDENFGKCFVTGFDNFLFFS